MMGVVDWPVVTGWIPANRNRQTGHPTSTLRAKSNQKNSAHPAQHRTLLRPGRNHRECGRLTVR